MGYIQTFESIPLRALNVPQTLTTVPNVLDCVSRSDVWPDTKGIRILPKALLTQETA